MEFFALFCILSSLFTPNPANVGIVPCRFDTMDEIQAVVERPDGNLYAMSFDDGLTQEDLQDVQKDQYITVVFDYGESSLPDDDSIIGIYNGTEWIPMLPDYYQN